MLAEMNVLANSEVGLMAATVGAAYGDSKEEYNSNSCATVHTFHTRAEMTSYKKAPARTTVEVADGTRLPVNGFRTIEVDLDQPGTTTKPVKMVAVAYVPRISRNPLSTCKAVEQWGRALVYHNTKAVLWFPGEESIVLNFCPPQGIVFRNKCETDPESRGSAGVGSKNG